MRRRPAADAAPRPSGGCQPREPWVYERAGRPCRRCGTLIRARGQGDDNRTTYWCPALPAMMRVGHKGADHVAPGNTIESFEAALEHGVDMIEFDVLRTRDGRLVLAHDYEDAAERECLTLEEGLDHFAGDGVRRRGARRGPEAARLRARGGGGAAERGLAERSLVSSTYLESLDRLGELSPGLRRGWSVPRARRDYTRSALALPAYGVSRWMRARLPAQAAARIRAGGCEAVMAHWLLVSAPARRGGARGRRRGVRVDRGRRRADPGASSAWAWTA